MAYTFKHGDRPLDDFTIQRAIGRGGFGEVYYAMSDGGREVALKYLKENPHVELRGVSHCINLKSPYLVSIFDVKKNADDEYFIIMEYCSGPSLRDLLITEPNGFPPEKAAFFTREIAKGLAYLHDRGIVHRDLKPGNIFFDDGYVKIGDYGLSKFIAVSRHSAQTASVGTVHYMAPEIGSGNYSKGVDIYALGVMLYEMLLGKVPFEGSSMAEVLMKHLTTQPELDELPEPFGRVIRKALEKDPNERFQDVSEMIDELLSGEAIQKSLAGFSAKSLEGAVRVGGRDPFDSPRPSPNPAPGGFVFKGNVGYGSPKPAQPYVAPAGKAGSAPAIPASAMPLPDKLARRLDRISHKLESKVSKLAGKAGTSATRGAGPQGPLGPGGIPFAQPAVSRSDRAKRGVLMVLLTIGLAVGFGLLVGYRTGEEEAGISGGALVAAMVVALAMGRAVGRWFSVLEGPTWALRLVQACTAAPLLAIGNIGFFELDYGVSVWLGLLAVATLADWSKSFEPDDDTEIGFGRVFSVALGALIATAIAASLTGHDPSPVMFIAAGVTGIASFVIQAGASWSASQRRGTTPLRGGPPPRGSDYGMAAEQMTAAGEGGPSPEVAANQESPGRTPNAPFELMQSTMRAAMQASRDSWQSDGLSTSALLPRPRSMIDRMFWSVIAFALMSGMIVTFLVALISRGMPYSDVTGGIVACVACAAFALFALRKTTAVKRIGFWRETIRPFLISLMLFGIGGTITGISREWNHCWQWSSECDCLEHECESDMATVRSEMQRVYVYQARNSARKAMEMVPNAFGLTIPETLGQLESIHAGCHCVAWSLGDEERVGLVSGLVICSLGLIAITFFTGRKPRPIATAELHEQTR